MPYVFGRNVARYEIIGPLSYVIFPYERVNDRYKITSLTRLGPIARQLKTFEKKLKERAVIRDKWQEGAGTNGTYLTFSG